ncbi:MAG: hypothetical protein ACKO2G_09520 [Verrucomicrobiales bacterium]
MKWKKLGRIFDPLEHTLPNGCEEFAQSPQALVFDDFVRIYFSTRVLEPSNRKYLSHVAFADFSKDLREVLSVSKHPVLPLGGPGCFDEHGIFPFHVVRHHDRVLAYTCGWSRRVSVSVETSIGLVVSHDNGRTFERFGIGPVLSASLQEPFLVGDGFVKIINDVFHMWYIFGTEWRRYAPGSAPERTYKIGHAVSPDGVHWQKEEGRRIIPDRLGEDEAQALPMVCEIEGIYHMFFCYRPSCDFRTDPANGYRIGHAWSKDLENWNRDDESFRLDGTPGEWDSDMQCYPHVFELDGRSYLLCNGNEFGRRGFGLAICEP